MSQTFFDILIGAGGSLLAAGLLRFGTGFLDFVPRQLRSISIGTSFEGFRARGPGDNYDDMLYLRIRNNGSGELFIVRCVYFQDRERLVPVYSNARPSQKYTKAYEVKFGPQWKEQTALIGARGDVNSYVPLASPPAVDIPQRKRGRLWIEYVYDGKTGIHRARL